MRQPIAHQHGSDSAGRAADLNLSCAFTSAKSLWIIAIASVALVTATVLSRAVLPGTEFSPFWPATGIVLGLACFFSFWHGVAMIPALVIWTYLAFEESVYDYLIFALIGAIIPCVVGTLVRIAIVHQRLPRLALNAHSALLVYAFVLALVTLPSAMLSGAIIAQSGIHAQTGMLQIASIYWMSEFAGFLLFFPVIFLMVQKERWQAAFPTGRSWMVLATVALMTSLEPLLPGLYKQLPIFICLPLLAFYALTERNPFHVHLAIAFWVITGLFVASEIPLVDGENNGVLFVSGYTLLFAGGMLTLHLIWLITNEQRNLAESLKRQTLLDPRTEMLNERGLRQTLSDKQCNGYVAIIVRLHQSKSIIESLGLDQFPVILHQITQRLRGVCRDIEDLGVIGGASIIAIMRESGNLQPGNDGSTTIINALAKDLNEGSYLENDSLSIQDLDIAMLSFDELNKDRLLEYLTVAAYLASQNPVNRTYTGRIDDPCLLAPLEHFRTFQDVKALLDRGGLEMWGQRIKPIGRHHHVEKVELLARIRNTEGEILPPAAFMDLFEQFGFQTEFDKYVIRTAFSLIADVDDGSRQFAINVSAQSFAQTEFPEFVKNWIHESGIDANHVSFEITESDALPNVETTTRNICALNELGIKVGIDDFGTGFATFSYLLDLPFNFVKVDGRFIKNIESDSASVQTVKAIVAIAQECKIYTVAEYVENEHIQQLLSGLGVDYAQGFCIDKPHPLHLNERI